MHTPTTISLHQHWKHSPEIPQNIHTMSQEQAYNVSPLSPHTYTMETPPLKPPMPRTLQCHMYTHLHPTCSRRAWPSCAPTVDFTHILWFLMFQTGFLGTHRFQQNVFCLGSNAAPVSKSSRKRKSVEGRLGRFSGDAWKGHVSFPSSVLWRKASPWSRLLARAAGKYSIVLCPGGKEISCVMFPKNLSWCKPSHPVYLLTQ